MQVVAVVLLILIGLCILIVMGMRHLHHVDVRPPPLFN